MKNPLMKKSILIAIIALIFFSTLATLYTNLLSENLYDETNEYLQEIATQTASSINSKINENITQLKTISLMIQEKKMNQQEIMEYLNDLTDERNELKRFGIADINGNAITSDNESFNIKSRDYFQQSIEGKVSSSATISDIVDEQLINVYSVPIYNQRKEINGVLFATFYSSKLSKTLETASFNNTGYSLIFNESGKIILTGSQVKHDNNIQKISDLSINQNIILKDIDIKGSGVIDFKDNNHQNNYFVYANIKNNDWLVASVFPREVVTAKIQQFIQTAFVTWILIGIGSACLVSYVYFIQKKNKLRLAQLAYEDSVTEHYNFNQFVESCRKYKELSNFVLINCDIKGFKWFNEIYGEHIADQLLLTIVECMDSFCAIDELCCRETNDHFALLLHKDYSKQLQQRLMNLAAYIRTQFNKKHSTSQFYFHFGVYEIDKEDTDIRNAFKKTQYVKDTFKELSKDDVIFFKEETFQKDLKAQQIEQNFQTSLENEDFKVFIQPKVDLKTGHIHAGEALVRWEHPVQGLIFPGNFIPIFEKNGMLEELDTFVLDNTLKTLQRWNQVYNKKIYISINVSRTYIFNEGYIDKLIELVNQYDVSPDQIEIEITESTALNHKKELLLILERLKENHLRIALDDFGSGYSSLNMLKDFPIDVVKLDQEFFRTNSYTHMRSHIIIEEVIELCHKLNIVVVAEGVETLEQNDFLSKHNCDYVQGYYYFKPMPIQEFQKQFIDQ